MTKTQVLQRIEDCGIVAVLRVPSADLLLPIAEALVAGGVVTIEVTMGTPDAIRGIERLARHFGDRATIGVGTAMDAATAGDALSAGARFVVSPMFDQRVVDATLQQDGVSIPGAFTPTEIIRAWDGGGDIIKVFPSAAVGPRYFGDILTPLPHLRLTPTSGITLENAPQWIKAGAVCLGIGTALVSKTAVDQHDWQAITASAHAFTAAVRQARGV